MNHQATVREQHDPLSTSGFDHAIEMVVREYVVLDLYVLYPYDGVNIRTSRPVLFANSSRGLIATYWFFFSNEQES